MDLETLYSIRDSLMAQIASQQAQLAVVNKAIAEQEAANNGGLSVADTINMRPETVAQLRAVMVAQTPPEPPTAPEPSDTDQLNPDAA